MTDRNVARVVGGLFIMATVPFSLSVFALDPVLGAANFLSRVSFDTSRVSAGVILELINHVAVVAIAVVIYPVLRRFYERLALGYVVARTIESTLFVVATLHLLTLVGVSEDFVTAGAPAESHFHALGKLLLDGHDWNKAPLAFTAFGVGALMLNIVLFRTRLVPRWISAFGLAAATSILTARVMQLCGLELQTSAVTMMDGPIFLQEMVFAGWLILRGFDKSVLVNGTPIR